MIQNQTGSNIGEGHQTSIKLEEENNILSKLTYFRGDICKQSFADKEISSFDSELISRAELHKIFYDGLKARYIQAFIPGKSNIFAVVISVPSWNKTGDSGNIIYTGTKGRKVIRDDFLSPPMTEKHVTKIFVKYRKIIYTPNQNTPRNNV